MLALYYARDEEISTDKAQCKKSIMSASPAKLV